MAAGLSLVHQPWSPARGACVSGMLGAQEFGGCVCVRVCLGAMRERERKGKCNWNHVCIVLTKSLIYSCC